MDIHEYQAKQLLLKYGVDVPPGEVVYQTHEAENILSWLNEEKIVREIARMLSGELITSEALAAACTLRNSSKETS